uniref:Uncharacterized protein n=1 Tax=Klebsiella pneumoniae TaxID=573 RepID=A0A482M2S6_KLEPN|nr:Hypothetical protein [Klebsiella pneumoniae]QBQ67117.1 Hypothetical protein [Klebsiella pneumoniae]QBQ67200.1 Hypothetical protein [Klebsiella pneumoniae]
MHTKFYILQSVHRVPESLSDSLNKKGGDYPPFFLQLLTWLFTRHIQRYRAVYRVQKARQRAATVQKRKRLIIEVAENPCRRTQAQNRDAGAGDLHQIPVSRTNDKPGQGKRSGAKN